MKKLTMPPILQLMQQMGHASPATVTNHKARPLEVYDGPVRVCVVAPGESIKLTPNFETLQWQPTL